MDSTIYTDAPLEAVLLAAPAILGGLAHNIEPADEWDGFSVAIDLFQDSNAEALAAEFREALGARVATMEELDACESVTAQRSNR